MLIRLGLFLMLTATTVPSVANNSALQKSCHEHPKLVGKCFTVHGRLSVFNGAPALRIWKVGTKRILGVSEQRYIDSGIRNVPEELEKQINQDAELFGDYTICPFTRSRPGVMQLVCIDSARNISVRKRAE